jgi:hypothetical protein
VNQTNFQCPKCNQVKTSENFIMSPDGIFPLISVCHSCSDTHYIEDVNCTCSVCKRKLPSNYFQHYRTRFKKNGMRLRVNTNCKDCTRKELSVVWKLKKENPPPDYLTPCPQCGKICYEKVEDIPEGVDGTNGPWQCDHDHKTGMFRGHLCKKCNTGTGLIGDNVEYFKNAIQRSKL